MSGMKLLIAEDNPMWLKVLQTNASSWGFVPVIAQDGQVALDELASDDAPRIAVLDWQMPHLDGVEVCRRIKVDSTRPYTYVMLLSSRDSKQDVVTGLDAGADEYMTKPADLDLLQRRLTAARRIIEAIPPKGWSRPRIAGYEVKQVLGQGAFATVWEAVHVATQRPVALKVLRIDLTTRKVMERFAHEIQVMQGLDHPYLATILDSHIDRQLGYYAMDLIRGGTIAHYVREHALPPLCIIRLVAQICEGLQHAHDRGIIHRDLKLSNVMVSDDGQPKIVDFGLGKSIFANVTTDPQQSIDGCVIGTPLFMSPEQARGEIKHLDQRSDIYSVGIVLYLLLLRKHPHHIAPQDRQQTIMEIAHGPVRRPTKLSPTFSKALERILLRALHPSVKHRYQRAGDMAADLHAFVDSRPAG
ncbi:Serine/threonine-protein kinase PrkC [Novipirellula galeiformis]|uniref:Serine/threonine-protein kinase PrkC n=2 Tax=Novipirellula galeiformis TaxID=2528004 RepID=A0A5C6CC14_9BACT|nr:Serine/threonine-protein kinase PrkC [Novipirellula galeiformis]